MLRFLWVHQKVLTKKANALNVKSLHSFPIAFFVAQFLSLFSFRSFPFALFHSLFPFSIFFRFSTIDLSFSLFSSKISKLKNPHFLPLGTEQKKPSHTRTTGQNRHIGMQKCLPALGAWYLVDWKYTSELPDPCMWMRSKGQKEHSKGNKLNLCSKKINLSFTKLIRP